jgi:hypothetical protein
MIKNPVAHNYKGIGTLVAIGEALCIGEAGTMAKAGWGTS